MIISEKILPSLLKGKTMEDIKTIYLDYKNITKIAFKSITFENILFLSLRNNNIKEIEFVSNFPFLWYLDLRENPVENFSPLKLTNTLGYLGVTIDKYSKQTFTSLKKLNIGILNINESFDNLYLMNSQTIIPNIIKCNDLIIQLSDLFKFSKQNLSILNLIIEFTQVNSKETNVKNSEAKEFVMFLEEWQKDLNLLINAKYDFSQNSDFHIKLEKKKLVYLFRIHESILTLNKEDSCVFDSKLIKDTSLLREYSYFEIKFIEIEDQFLQILILIIILLYILGIITKELSAYTVKYIMRKLVLNTSIYSSNVFNILNMNKFILIGLFYKLLENLNKIDLLNGNKTNNVTHLHHSNEIKNILQMNKLIYKINELKNQEELYLIDFSIYPNYDARKNEISNKLIFYDKTLGILKETIVLIQHLYDFIVLNKLDNKIKTKVKESKDYMIFLEIRGCSFSYLDNQSQNNEIFECFSDRKFAEFNNKKFGNQMHFTTKHLNSIKNQVKSKHNELDEFKHNKYSSLNNSDCNSIEKNEEKESKNIYQFIAKNKISIKKKHNLKKSQKEKKQESLFLTNSIMNSDTRSLKRNFSQNLLQNKNKYVEGVSKLDAVSSKQNETNMKLSSKFSINDDKLNNFCKDLIKIKNAKKDDIKGSKNSGFISANKVLDNKYMEEKQGVSSNKINAFLTQKEYSSKTKIVRRNSSNINYQDIEEVRKYYKYLSVLNKIRNLSIIGSTRIDTPSNKRVRLYEEVKSIQQVTLKKGDLNTTNNEAKTENSKKPSSNLLFRHNKPLCTNLANLHKFQRTKSTINFADSENMLFPNISNINISSNFNISSANIAIENNNMNNQTKDDNSQMHGSSKYGKLLF